VFAPSPPRQSTVSMARILPLCDHAVLTVVVAHPKTEGFVIISPYGSSCKCFPSGTVQPTLRVPLLSFLHTAQELAAFRAFHFFRFFRLFCVFHLFTSFASSPLYVFRLFTSLRLSPLHLFTS
jgi:hypothetical protein